MSVFRAYPRFLDPRPMDAIFFISAQILLSTIHCFELFLLSFAHNWSQMVTIGRVPPTFLLWVGWIPTFLLWMAGQCSRLKLLFPLSFADNTEHLMVDSSSFPFLLTLSRAPLSLPAASQCHWQKKRSTWRRLVEFPVPFQKGLVLLKLDTTLPLPTTLMWLSSCLLHPWMFHLLWFCSTGFYQILMSRYQLILCRVCLVLFKNLIVDHNVKVVLIFVS